MSDQWPPSAPDVKKAFKEVHDGKEKTDLPATSDGIVTKKAIEELEKQIKTTAPEMHLTPVGAVRPSYENERRLAQLERMRQKMKQKEGKARDDFGQTMER